MKVGGTEEQSRQAGLINFPRAGDASPDVVRLRGDKDLVAKLKADNQPVFIEIQGHTDATGSEAVNQRLGLERAEAVRMTGLPGSFSHGPSSERLRAMMTIWPVGGPAVPPTAVTR